MKKALKSECLMVIIPDRLSELVNKGEITERYYNPGNFFNEVHIVMTNDDKPNVYSLNKTVGNAELRIHNLPVGSELLACSIGWQNFILRRWSQEAVCLAEKIRPSLIRCHGAHLNAYAAYCIKKIMGIPYVVSLHINPDEDVRGRTNGLIRRYVNFKLKKLEALVLKNSDFVMPVYKPIVPYLNRLCVQNYEVCYNVLNPSNLRHKKDYRLHNPVRIVCVGRQFKEKNPDNLIRAVAAVPNIQLTIIGDGPYHSYLIDVAKEYGVSERVVFKPAVPNDELCKSLIYYDIFAVHTEYWEISKSVMEALLTGLPLIINERVGESVPELNSDICCLVKNTPEDYSRAIRKLITEHSFRESLGNRGYIHAQRHWSPAITEAKFVAIYQKITKNI